MNGISFRLVESLQGCASVSAGGLQFVKGIFEGLGRKIPWGFVLNVVTFVVISVAWGHRKCFARVFNRAVHFPMNVVSGNQLPKTFEGQSVYFPDCKALPCDVVVTQIFSQLSPKDCAQAFQVCRSWNRLGNDKRLLSKIPWYFGPEDWEYLFGVKVDDAPQLPAMTFEELNEPCPIWKDKKVKETHLLMLIPKGVSLQSFAKMIQESTLKDKSTYGPPLRYPGDETMSQSQSEWVLLTKKVIPESVKKSNYHEKLKLLPQEEDYDGQSLLQTVISALMYRAKNGKQLFESTYRRSVVVNWSGYRKFYDVGDYQHGLRIDLNVNEEVGLAAVRKLQVAGTCPLLRLWNWAVTH